MKKIIKYTSASILLISSLISLWFFGSNLHPLKPALYSFVVFLFIGIGVFLKLFAGRLVQKIKNALIILSSRKHFTVITMIMISLIAIVARLYFLSIFSYAPVSDPSTFYDSAQKISAGQGMTGDTYVAFFPYLSGYENILSLTMRFIGSPWLATILLNTIFEVGAAALLYLLIKKMTTPKSHLPLISFGVWMLNPLGIVFSVLSLPIVVVNFFIIAAIFATYLLVEKISQHKITPIIILSVVIGIVTGLGNCFRPIFSVVLIALFLLFLYLLFTHPKSKKLLFLLSSSFILVLLLFVSLQKLNVAFVSKQTNLHAVSSPSGWSVFVGSNWESDGSWNLSDEIRMSKICEQSLAHENFAACHSELQKAGIERYKSYGIDGTLSLFIRKLHHLASNQNYMYNAEQSITNYYESRTAKSINIYIILYVLTLFLLSARFLYSHAKYILGGKRADPIVLFIAMLMIGFFFSSMFVESASRYAIILYPAFIIFAVLSLTRNSLKR